MNIKRNVVLLLVCVIVFSCGETKKQKETAAQQESKAPKKLKALIIDGQNNHYVWPKTTMMMKDYLENTNMFDVHIQRMDSVWLGIKYKESRPESYSMFIEKYPVGDASYAISNQPIKTSDFAIDFTGYDVIVSNLGFDVALWPETTQRDFENYMKKGGGLVVVHAANNAFGNWEEYNRMIGLGAWGGRDESSGPYVY